jgi:hypothetical protein
LAEDDESEEMEISQEPAEETEVLEDIATETEPAGKEKSVEVEESLVLDGASSGTCGKNLTWTLTDEGVFTISGTGKMADYDDASQVPWNEYRERIEKVIVEAGVLSISSYAFQDCENLVEVSLPEGLRAVGGYVFYNTAIRELTVPGSLTSVTVMAFYGCTKLETLILSEGIESIEMGAFQECSAIQNITFPTTLKSVWAGTFSGTPWREKQGMLLIINGVLVDYDESQNDTYDVVVPAEVDEIGYRVFLGQVIDSVTILNPTCELPDYGIQDTILYGYRNSTAEKYVEEFGEECNVTFVALDSVERGNINGDDDIDLKDVTLLFQFVNKQITALDNEATADVDGDGKITLKDVTQLFQYVNKQIDTL